MLHLAALTAAGGGTSLKLAGISLEPRGMAEKAGTRDDVKPSHCMVAQ